MKGAAQSLSVYPSKGDTKVTPCWKCGFEHRQTFKYGPHTLTAPVRMKGQVWGAYECAATGVINEVRLA